VSGPNLKLYLNSELVPILEIVKFFILILVEVHEECGELPLLSDVAPVSNSKGT
jgi:hypothetical protein